MKVLFVCKDNSCVSIIAEALTKHYWENSLEVASAGISPLGYIPPEVKNMLEETGISTEELYSKGLSDIDVREFQLIANLHEDSLEDILPESFNGILKDWSELAKPCFEMADLSVDCKNAIEKLVLEDLTMTVGFNYDSPVAFPMTLGMKRVPIAIKPLCVALKDKDDVKLRCAAAWALENLRDSRAVEPLTQAFMHDEDSGVRYHSLAAIKAIGGSEAMKALRQGLNHKERDVRVDAAIFLRDLGDSFGIETLARELDKDLMSEDIDTRRAAIEQLKRIEDASTIDLLTKALKDTDHYNRSDAAKTLGKIGDPRAVDALDQAMRDQKWRGRIYAIEALRKIGNARAENYIKKYLDDESEYVQNAAREALNILSFQGVEIRDSLDFDNPVDEKPYVNKLTAYVESGDVFCSIHRVAMLEDKVRISSGLEVFTDQVYEDHATDHSRASEKLFPNLNRKFHSGCFDFGKEETLVLYCPECRKAEGKWEGEYWKDTDEKFKESEKYWAEMPEDKEGKMRHVVRFYVDRKMTFDKGELFYQLRYKQWTNREDMAKFLQIIKEEGVEVGEYLAQLFSKLELD